MIRSTDDEPMTIGERYSSAVESSNLKLKETAGDIDLIISVGFVESDLASTLLRLQVEYDSVRGQLRTAQIAMHQGIAEAKRQKDVPGSDGELPWPLAARRTELMLEEVERIALSSHITIKGQLPSLRQATGMVGAFALQEAPRRRFRAPSDYVLKLAQVVLDVHISPTCRACMGRGFNGNLQRGENQTLCRACSGSGSRRDALGRDDADRLFASHLLAELSALMQSGEAQIRSKRADVRALKALVQQAEGEVGAKG